MLPLTPWGFRKTSYSVSLSRIYKRSKLDFYLGSRVDHHLSHCVAERKPFFPNILQAFYRLFWWYLFCPSIIKCWGKLELVDPLNRNEKLWMKITELIRDQNMLVDGKSVWWSYGQKLFFLISQSQHGGKNWLNNSLLMLIIFKQAPRPSFCDAGAVFHPNNSITRRKSLPSIWSLLISPSISLADPYLPPGEMHDQKVEDYSSRGQHLSGLRCGGVYPLVNFPSVTR